MNDTVTIQQVRSPLSATSPFLARVFRQAQGLTRFGVMLAPCLPLMHMRARLSLFTCFSLCDDVTDPDVLPPSLTPSYPPDCLNNPTLLCAFSSGVQTDPEGALWRDPPHYWEQIVWPAYVRAHEKIFENGDVENGKSNGTVEGLVLVEGLQQSMGDIIDLVCERLVEVA